MDPLRNQSVLQTRGQNAANVPLAQQPSTSKKRKAEEAPPATERSSKLPTIEFLLGGNENIAPLSTPPTDKLMVSIEPVERQRERTPGRVGPVKRESFSTSPDIKPFKGPPGKKVRKTRVEKEEEYKQFVLETESHPFHDLHVCFKKGPNGSPTYDKAGFQLDYDKVAQWMKPKAYNKRAMIRGMDKSIEKQQRDSERMAEIFFEKGEAPTKPEHMSGDDHWKDRVSKDLNVPWHKIQVSHFEEWEKRGFKKARKGEYLTFSEAEKARMFRMMSGASLRK